MTPEYTDGSSDSVTGEAADYNETQAAIDAGIAIGEPRQLAAGEVYSVIVPKGAGQRLVEVPEERGDRPRRATGTYRPATVEAFVAVIGRHENPQRTTVWVHPQDGNIVAVFNDHEPTPDDAPPSSMNSIPGWRDHRAHLSLQKTPEWQHWIGRNGRLMGQTEFAEHIEDGSAQIVTPAAADMLELAQTFHAHTDAQFRSAQRLRDGQVQVQYDEQIDASAGTSGQMQIPDTFELAVAPFLGEDPYRLTARLRYRIGGGKLQLGYKLVERPEDVLAHTLGGIATQLREKFPATFIGEPGS